MKLQKSNWNDSISMPWRVSQIVPSSWTNWINSFSINTSGINSNNNASTFISVVSSISTNCLWECSKVTDWPQSNWCNKNPFNDCRYNRDWYNGNRHRERRYNGNRRKESQHNGNRHRESQECQYMKDQYRGLDIKRICTTRIGTTSINLRC